MGHKPLPPGVHPEIKNSYDLVYRVIIAILSGKTNSVLSILILISCLSLNLGGFKAASKILAAVKEMPEMSRRQEEMKYDIGKINDDLKNIHGIIARNNLGLKLTDEPTERLHRN